MTGTKIHKYQEALDDFLESEGEVNHIPILYDALLTPFRVGKSNETREYSAFRVTYITKILSYYLTHISSPYLNTITFRNNVVRYGKRGDIPDFYTLGSVITTLQHGWRGRNEEFFLTIPPLFLWWYGILMPDHVPKDNKLYDLLFIAKHRFHTWDKTEPHPGSDCKQDHLDWVSKFRKLAVYSDTLLRDMKIKPWTGYTLQLFSVLSTVCMMTILKRNISGELDKDEESVYINAIDRYTGRARVVNPVSPQLL